MYFLQSQAKDAAAIVQPETDISCGEFIKFFVRLGVERRDALRVKQIERQAYLDKIAEDERKSKLENTRTQAQGLISFDFSEKDEATTHQKLLRASTLYDKGAPGAKSLEGFECESLTVPDFRDLMKRIFNLSLNAFELGVIFTKWEKKEEKKRENNTNATAAATATAVDSNANNDNAPPPTSSSSSPPAASSIVPTLTPADAANAATRTQETETSSKEPRIYCKDFIVAFLKLGIDERHRLHILQLEKQRKAIQKAHEDHIKKVEEVREKTSFRIDYGFRDEHLQSAITKLTQGSLKYDKSRGVALTSFDPLHISPADFKEALVKIFNVSLTPLELGAVVCKVEALEIEAKKVAQALSSTTGTLAATSSTVLPSSPITSPSQQPGKRKGHASPTSDMPATAKPAANKPLKSAKERAAEKAEREAKEAAEKEAIDAARMVHCQTFLNYFFGLGHAER